MLASRVLEAGHPSLELPTTGHPSLELPTTGHPSLELPTTGTLDRDAVVYLANSRLRSFADGQTFPPEKLRPTDLPRAPRTPCVYARPMRAPLVSLLSTAGLALGVTLALACAPDDPPADPALRAACDTLCEAQIECEDTSQTMTACTNACIADVGTPGEACSDAIQVYAICVADHCGDATACSAQELDRTTQCGGTG